MRPRRSLFFIDDPRASFAGNLGVVVQLATQADGIGVVVILTAAGLMAGAKVESLRLAEVRIA